MKFNAVLMTLDQNTKIRLVVTMYGMKFSSEHYPEYYLDHAILGDDYDQCPCGG